MPKQPDYFLVVADPSKPERSLTPPKVLAAAKGHAKEMSQLGYFSHFSPTPGRRTPFDRMKLAGYDLQAAVSLQELFVRKYSAGVEQDWMTGLFASHPL